MPVKYCGLLSLVNLRSGKPIPAIVALVIAYAGAVLRDRRAYNTSLSTVARRADCVSESSLGPINAMADRKITITVITIELRPDRTNRCPSVYEFCPRTTTLRAWGSRCLG